MRLARGCAGGYQLSYQLLWTGAEISCYQLMCQNYRLGLTPCPVCTKGRLTVKKKKKKLSHFISFWKSETLIIFVCADPLLPFHVHVFLPKKAFKIQKHSLVSGHCASLRPSQRLSSWQHLESRQNIHDATSMVCASTNMTTQTITTVSHAAK